MHGCLMLWKDGMVGSPKFWISHLDDGQIRWSDDVRCWMQDRCWLDAGHSYTLEHGFLCQAGSHQAYRYGAGKGFSRQVPWQEMRYLSLKVAAAEDNFGFDVQVCSGHHSGLPYTQVHIVVHAVATYSQSYYIL